MKLQCSDHAKQRIKERLGVEGKREVKQLTSQAFHHGLSVAKDYIPRQTLIWVNKKVNENYFGRCGTNWRIYKEHLFLFSKTHTLITVITIPKHIVPKKRLEKDFRKIKKMGI